MSAIKLQLITPSSIAADVEATEVTLPGGLGEFTILPGHAPYVSQIKPGVVRYISGKDTKSLVISGGFAEVTDDSLLVLCQSVHSREELDEVTLRADLQEASAQLEGLSALQDPEYDSVKEKVDTLVAQLAFIAS